MKQLLIKSTAKFILYEFLCKHKPAISVTHSQPDIVIDSRMGQQFAE